MTTNEFNYAEMYQIALAQVGNQEQAKKMVEAWYLGYLQSTHKKKPIQ